MNNYNLPYEYYVEEMERAQMTHKMPGIPMMPDYANIMNYGNPNMEIPTEELNSAKGFIHGNMFDNLYEPYKHYKEDSLRATNKREELSQKVQQYNFAITDLCFFLDNNPKDEDIRKIYNQYLGLYDNAVMEYERNFGPLTCDSKTASAKGWAWDNAPWPWEVM